MTYITIVYAIILHTKLDFTFIWIVRPLIDENTLTVTDDSDKLTLPLSSAGQYLYDVSRGNVTIEKTAPKKKKTVNL